MQNFDFIAYKKMVKTYQENNDPTGWFDTIYKNTQGDFTKVFWADLEPSPYLVNWLKENPIKKIKPNTQFPNLKTVSKSHSSNSKPEFASEWIPCRI